MGERHDRAAKAWTKKQMGDLLVSTYPLVFDSEPTRTEAEMLLAMLWVETGGTVNNNNFGNISIAGFYNGEERFLSDADYWRPPWYWALNPGYETLHERMLSGKAPSAFRHYSLPDAGMQDYLGKLKRQYPSILSAARSGDPSSLVSAVHDSGYSTDWNDSHIDSVRRIRDSIQSAGVFRSLPGGKTKPGLGFGLLAMMGAGLGYLATRKKKH